MILSVWKFRKNLQNTHMDVTIDIGFICIPFIINWTRDAMDLYRQFSTERFIPI